MKISAFVTSIILYSCVSADKSHPVVFSLPGTLKEVSGIEITEGSGNIWVNEDSGNNAALYALDKNGKIIQTVYIKNADNNDWEDLSSDKDGNIYIGDFGNNDNERENLAIYKVNAADLTEDEADVSESIEFYYPEQKDFPPKKSKLIYDAEAFFFFDDNFYVFTKNRSSKSDGTTKLYKIANKKGRNPAQLIGQFKTCGEFRTCAITSADISSDGKKMIMISCANAWLFENYSGDDFFGGKITEIDLSDYSQKEGVCFKNNSEVYIADEKDKKTGGNVYQLRIDN